MTGSGLGRRTDHHFALTFDIADGEQAQARSQSDPNHRERALVQANPGYLTEPELGQPAWKANPGYLIDHLLVAGLHVGD